MNSGDAADLGAATNETEHTSVLAELTHDLAFMLTPDGRVASVNQAFEQTIGYSRDEACSLPVDQFVAPDCAASLRQLLEQTSASAGPTTLDLAFQTRDGRRILA